MSNDDAHTYGPALYAFLEGKWTAAGQTRNAYLLQRGMNAATISRWAEGMEPKLSVLRTIAEVTETPILEVLVAVGVLSADEAAVEVLPPSLDAALQADPSISVLERRLLHEIHESFARAEIGPGDVVEIETDAKPRRARRRGR